MEVSPYDLLEKLKGQEHVVAIPPHLQPTLAPAQICLQEWQDYWVTCSGVEQIRVGTDVLDPVCAEVFRLRFENRLGLTAIQPLASGRPMTPPCYVEVISAKFPTPVAHMVFYRALLDDLFARAVRLPFTFGGPTARGVVEALRPPTPLFTLYFLDHFAADLATALAIVQSAPHRKLHDAPDLVPLAEVTEADADVLLSIVRSPERLAHARGFALAERLHGYAPVHVWQRCPEETVDTPENRFVRDFLCQLLTAAEGLPAQRWWSNVPPARQATVREVAALLRQALVEPPLAVVGPLLWLPLNSQVLLRRDGYRELLTLWQRFQQARRPFFAALQQAIEVRDIATLYEVWAFFRLVDEIKQAIQEEPVLHLTTTDEYGLEWGAEARFGRPGCLLYNHTYQRPKTYSLPLRPDFAWVRDGRLEVVLDAKFRLEREVLEAEDDKTPAATAKRTDLYKMHTYRDALDIRAAVAIYPGDQALFYDVTRRPREDLTLANVLTSDFSGVGALPLKPG
jgi:hypothetical protein